MVSSKYIAHEILSVSLWSRTIQATSWSSLCPHLIKQMLSPPTGQMCYHWMAISLTVQIERRLRWCCITCPPSFTVELKLCSNVVVQPVLCHPSAKSTVAKVSLYMGLIWLFCSKLHRNYDPSLPNLVFPTAGQAIAWLNQCWAAPPFSGRTVMPKNDGGSWKDNGVWSSLFSTCLIACLWPGSLTVLLALVDWPSPVGEGVFTCVHISISHPALDQPSTSCLWRTTCSPSQRFCNSSFDLCVIQPDAWTRTLFIWYYNYLNHIFNK